MCRGSSSLAKLERHALVASAPIVSAVARFLEQRPCTESNKFFDRNTFSNLMQLMDEISTGLDSSTTYQIVNCLRNICHFTEVGQ